MRNATYLDFSLDEYRDRYDRLQAALEGWFGIAPEEIVNGNFERFQGIMAGAA